LEIALPQRHQHRQDLFGVQLPIELPAAVMARDASPWSRVRIAPFCMKI
jgi:hypothetical protein